MLVQASTVVLATCLPRSMLYAGGLATDAENELKRLRIYGINRLGRFA